MTHGRSGQVLWVTGQRGCRVRSCVRCEAVNTVFRGSSLSSLVVGCTVSLASRWEAVCNVFIGRSRCARLSPRRVAPMSLLLSTCPAGGGNQQKWLSGGPGELGLQLLVPGPVFEMLEGLTATCNAAC